MLILNATAMLQDSEFCLHTDMCNFILNYAKPNTSTIEVTLAHFTPHIGHAARPSDEVTLDREIFHSLTWEKETQNWSVFCSIK
jgi:hypothetical protein